LKPVKVRTHVLVSGRVQGVFFRSETESEARSRNVKGWIRNLRNGGVEAVFEGEKEDVEELIRFCHHGPAGARVTNVKVIGEEYTGEFRDFKTRY